VTHLAPITDEEVFERISTSTSSYTAESNEDTFKPDTVFESFHYQARISISNQALLAGFLMLWLKRCVVPTLPLEVIVTDVVYPTVLLAHEKINIPSSRNGIRHPERLAGVNKKSLSSGGYCRLPKEASGRPGGEAGSEDSQSQSRAPLYVPNGLVRHALPVANDGCISLRGLHRFRLEVGELELVAILYVFCSKIGSE